MLLTNIQDNKFAQSSSNNYVSLYDQYAYKIEFILVFKYKRIDLMLYHIKFFAYLNAFWLINASGK